MEFPQRLYQLRRQAGISQEELANVLNLSRQAVQKWEAGSSRPDMDNLTALADYFHVSLDWLIRGEEAANTAVQPEPEKEVQVIREIHHYHEGWSYEYRSKRTLWGVPLVHVNVGTHVRVARGIIAIGNISVGVVSLGAICVGLLSLGAVSLALVALGALCLGGCTVGAVCFGYLCFGGVTVGLYCVGGVAMAANIAVGGVVKAPVAVGDVVPQGANAFSLAPDGTLDPALAGTVFAALDAHAPGWVSALLKLCLQIFC